jgi:Cd2+/Zn2+-exporting ATPase
MAGASAEISMSVQEERSILCVEGMCCADEQSVIEKKLHSLNGVHSYKFNLVAQRLYLTHSIPQKQIINALKEAGFSSRPLAARLDDTESPIHAHRTTIPVALSTAFLVSGMIVQWTGTAKEYAVPLYICAIFIGGWKIFPRAVKSLRLFSFDMNVLMSAAVIGAMAIGEWAEGAAVIVLFAVSHLLEEKSMERTRRALSFLLESAPSTATVLRDGKEETVPVADVRPGDMMIIRPGEKIAADGEVITGHSFVNQAAITGESLPAEKHAGSLVYAGTINNGGTLEIRAAKTGEETTFAHIIHLVEEAQAERSPSQDFVDRFSKIYTPAVIGMALLVAVVPPLFFHEVFAVWFYRSLVLLVIACPCALVISTPVTIVTALTAAARKGILVKGGRYIEEASKIKAVVFDKTGTLTYGTPSITDIVSLNSLSDKDILRIAACAEMRSEHSLASAVLEKAESFGIDLPDRIEQFQSFPGKGLSIVLEEKKYYVGSHGFVEELQLCSADVEKRLFEFEAQGKTVMMVCSDTNVLGIIAGADTLRQESVNAVEQLSQDSIKEIFLLSGDGEGAVRAVADGLQIKNYFANLLPEEKVEKVKQLKNQFRHVAMVGDGINDAPALAAATLGIAMGGAGTDVAMETADVVLMKDDLSHVHQFFTLSRYAMSVLRQNIAIALAVKVIFLLLGLFGAAALWMAIIADDGVTLLVIANSLRLLRK